jgi:hypothetical protein
MPVDAYKITLLVVTGVMLVTFAWRLRSSAVVRPAALRETARRAGLAVTPAVEPVLIARLRAQTRAILVGTTVAFAAGAATLLMLPTPDGGVTAPFLLIALSGVGALIGNAIAEGRAALVPLDDRPRLARTPSPTRTDYLSTFDRWTAPVSLSASGLGLAGLGLLITGNPDGAFTDASLVQAWLPAAALWVLALAAAAIGRVLTSRILQRGQPAADDVELAWSDALRRGTLRVFAQTPTAVVYSSMAAALLTVSSTVSLESSAGRAISLAATLTLVVITLALSGFSLWLEFTTRTPHYLERLWPAVAAQLRDPDRQVAASTRGAQ